MNYVFHDKLDDYVTIYCDDILLCSPSIEAHETHLHWTFNQLQKHWLKAKIKKYCFSV